MITYGLKRMSSWFSSFFSVNSADGCSSVSRLLDALKERKGSVEDKCVHFVMLMGTGVM